MADGKVFTLVFLALLSLWSEADCSVEDQIIPLSEELWIKVSNGWPIVVSGALNNFFLRYIERDWLNLLEVEFTGGQVNWILDFLNLGMTYSYARAYFRLLDVYSGSFGQYIRSLTIEDMDTIVNVCEMHSGSSTTGILSQSQFINGFKEVIFRPMPVALLFVTYISNPEIGGFGLDHLTSDEFNEMVSDMDVNGDGSITVLEMGQFWETGGFGSYYNGMKLFDKLDYSDKGSLSPLNMQELFNDLDCRDGGNGYIDFREFVQLDLIMQDMRIYPGGACDPDIIQ